MPTQEPSSEVSAVLRREAEQSAANLRMFVRAHSGSGCRVLSVGDDCKCLLCDIDRLESFARRQRAQALNEAANAEPLVTELKAAYAELCATYGALFDQIDDAIRVPAAAEGSEVDEVSKAEKRTLCTCYGVVAGQHWEGCPVLKKLLAEGTGGGE